MTAVARRMGVARRMEASTTCISAVTHRRGTWTPLVLLLVGGGFFGLFAW
jgi:hypothetical protein